VIKALQRKAEERNPDEFYFAMQSARTKDGVHVVSKSESNKYSQEELALMRTQDAGYLRAKASAEAKVGPSPRAAGGWGGGVALRRVCECSASSSRHLIAPSLPPSLSLSIRRTLLLSQYGTPCSNPQPPEPPLPPTHTPPPHHHHPEQKIERMKGRLHFIGAPRVAKHKVFLDSKKEAREFDAEKFFDCPRELLDRAYNRPRRAQLEQESAVSALDAKSAAKMER